MNEFTADADAAPCANPQATGTTTTRAVSGDGLCELANQWASVYTHAMCVAHD
jgi:hypothetical protein